MPDECVTWAVNMDLYYIEVLEENSKNRASRSNWDPDMMLDKWSGVQKCVSFM